MVLHSRLFDYSLFIGNIINGKTVLSPKTRVISWYTHIFP